VGRRHLRDDGDVYGITRHNRRQRLHSDSAGNLAATVEEGTWVVTSHLIANAIILPMSGWLARYQGRKKLLLKRPHHNLPICSFSFNRLDGYHRIFLTLSTNEL
jgi:hypothetical protein